MGLVCQAVLWQSKSLFDAQDTESSSVDAKSVLKMRDSVMESLIDVATSKLDAGIRLQVFISLTS